MFVADLVRRVRTSAAGPEDLQSYKLLIDSLYASPGSIIPGGIAAILTCFLCFKAADDSIFAYLTVLTSFIVLLRVVTLLRYRDGSRVSRSIRELKNWGREYLLGATALSATLGFNCFLALTATESDSAHMIGVATTVAFSSGYVARNAGRPGFVVMQLIFFSVPMAAGLLMSPDIFYNAIGYFVFLFVASSMAILRSVHRNLIALGEANKTALGLADVLKVQNVTLDAALNNMNLGLAMFDRDMRLAVKNRRFTELYDLPDAACEAGTNLAVIGRETVVRGALTSDQAHKLIATCRRAGTTGRDLSFEVVTRGRRLLISVESASDGRVVVLTEDATERRQAEARIEQLARFDELTGLANRFEFSSVLAERCQPERDASFSLLYVDVDNFKQINDSFGHEVGDGILVEAADRLREAAGSEDLVARFGGDEFVILHLGGTRESACALGKRIVDGMSEPFSFKERLIYATASIGIALSPDHGTGSSDLLRHADVALYKAKAAGRSTFVVFSPEMGAELAERQQLEELLRRALEREELTLFYQPIVQLGTGKVMAYEALMRWRHPSLGMISPALFIPIAEQTGLIRRLGAFALERACRDAVCWPDVTFVSVNVSPVQFRTPEALIQDVRSALERSGLPPERLSLEVTESLFLEDAQGALDAIHAIRAIGVKFSLDDFGIGYSSLGYLSKYPFSQVKMDRSFAQSVTSDPTSQAIIESVSQLARRLGMRFVVEGIETDAQKRAIEGLGADFGQGYLFGRPQPLDAMVSEIPRRVA